MSLKKAEELLPAGRSYLHTVAFITWLFFTFFLKVTNPDTNAFLWVCSLPISGVLALFFVPTGLAFYGLGAGLLALNKTTTKDERNDILWQIAGTSAWSFLTIVGFVFAYNQYPSHQLGNALTGAALFPIGGLLVLGVLSLFAGTIRSSIKVIGWFFTPRR